MKSVHRYFVIMVCYHTNQNPKKPMNKKELNKFIQITKQVLSPKNLNAVATETGLIQREREVTGSNLMLSLIQSLATSKVETIADLQRGFNAMTGKNIRYKPFYNQLSKPEFPAFMMSVLEMVISQFAFQSMEAMRTKALHHFKDIVIQDGSSFAVKDKLQKVFPGRFTKISPAAVELHATMSLFSDNVTDITLSADKEGERHFLPEPITLKNKLLLGDRGYEDIRYCGDVQNAGGSYIFRSRSTCNPTVVKAFSPNFRRIRIKEMPLKNAIKKFHKKTVDLDICRKKGKEFFPCRLVVAWNPKKKQYWYLVTNLPRTKFPADLVVQYYRLRWQIELVFKEWKSYANLHKFDTENPHIAEGLIWASITAAFIKRFLAIATQKICQTVEISTRKTAMCLKTHFTELVSALLRHTGIKIAFKKLVRYLEQNAGRAHPARDRLSGSRNCGLEACFIIEMGGPKLLKV